MLLDRAAGSRADSGIPWRVPIASDAACDAAGYSTDWPAAAAAAGRSDHLFLDWLGSCCCCY